jgi:uncharacterized protein
MRRAIRKSIVGAVLLSAVVIGAVAMGPLGSIAAGRILTPERHAPTLPPPAGCVERTFSGDSGPLEGWHCHRTGTANRGTILYLHGIAGNRDSAAAVVERFLPHGFNVIAYDARGHGSSSGELCTYGYHEKIDVRRVIAEVGPSRVFLIGHSLGAAVALQAAAIEPLVRGVVAVSTFVDLRTIATERGDVRALPSWLVAWGVAQVERTGRFDVEATSPLRAAASIKVPVLLVHGADDRRPAPSHSERVLTALGGHGEMIVVPGAGHHDVLGPGTWSRIEQWLLGISPPPGTFTVS